MSKWQNRLYNFLYGRYGADELYKFCLIIYLMLFIVNVFLNSIVIFWIETFIVVVTFYRMFSCNIKKRRKENNFYLGIINKFKKKFELIGKKWRDRNTHMYKNCKYCKQVLRLPLKKGLHTVKCPNCKKRFEVKCRKDEKIEVEVIKKRSNLKES